MSTTTIPPDPNLHEAVEEAIRTLQRLADYSLPMPIDRRMLQLGERKEYLNSSEHEELLALVAFAEARSIEKLQAQRALRQLQPYFPREVGL